MAKTARAQNQKLDPTEGFRQLTDHLVQSFGDELTSEILQGFEQQRPVTVRANRLKICAEELECLFAEQQISVQRVVWDRDVFILDKSYEKLLRSLPAYTNGELYLQSLSSLLPAHILDPQPGESILDMTAAPGGKTTQLAALSDNRAFITACERSVPRAERLRFNLERQGAGRVSLLVQDARKLDSFLSFDKVLLDAPCSGSGTVLNTVKGLKCDFSNRLLENCVRMQIGLLRKASELVRDGGVLVYSTCSILPEENEQCLLPLIKEGHFEVIPINASGFSTLETLPCKIPGALCIKPTRLHEGFFVCQLRRTGG